MARARGVLCVVSGMALGCGDSSTRAEPDDTDTPPEANATTTSTPVSTGGVEGGDSSTGESSPQEQPGATTADNAMQLGEKVELRVDDFTVPTVETSYKCFDYTLSSAQLAHMTAFEAVINAANVHHYVVTLTDEPSGNAPGYDCFDLEGDMIWAWAPGQTRLELPPEAGFLVGDQPGGSFTLRLQIHYNNPSQTQGIVDTSGFNVWITDQLREHNAGSLVFGDIEGIEIPPGESAHEHVMTCRSEVTEAMFPGPLNVFGASMHAHDIGSVLFTEVWRDGEMVHELNRDDPFVFDNQNFKFFEYQLLPGDEIVNRCFYDSTGRTETTYGGPGTLDEMCWDTVIYYPKIPGGFDYCTSYD